MTMELSSLVTRLEAAVIRLEKSGGPGPAKQIAQSSGSSQAKKSSSAPAGPAPASNLRYDASHYVYNYDAPWLSGKQESNGEVEVAPDVDFGDINIADGPAMGPWGEESSTPYIVAWDDMLNGPFKNFLAKSKSIGGDVETISKLVEGCFLTQRTFLICATKSNKPSDADLPKILERTGKQIQAVVDFRESNRSSRFFNHLSSVSEAIPALSWVTIEPAPSPFIKEMGDAGTFYTNRILKEYKEKMEFHKTQAPLLLDKDRTHVGWTQDWNAIFKEMQAYVKQYHTTGVSWNPKGGRALDNLTEAPLVSGVPPPPPPGCVAPPQFQKPQAPPPMVDNITGKVHHRVEGGVETAFTGYVDKLKQENPDSDTGSNGKKMPLPPVKRKGDFVDFFGELKQGLQITSGLTKVTSDMQTHKNPSLREGPKPFVKQTEPAPSSSPAVKTTAPQKPPRCEQEGRKWFVEYQKNNKNIIIDDTSMDQTVYIFKCEGSVIQVKGKLNNIILDSCKKTSLVFDSLVSSFEVVNCQSAEVQVLGTINSCIIEKTDGCQLYLSKESIGLEVVTSKSTTMNLLLPKDDGQYTELPIPEQFKTQIKDGKLETLATEIAG